MPAESKAQRKAAGMALAARKGKLNPHQLQGAAMSMYESNMSNAELEKYASTEEKGLPRHKK